MKKIYIIFVFLFTGIQICSGAQDLYSSEVYAPSDYFITKWDLSKTGSSATSVFFGITVSGTVNYHWKTTDNSTSGTGTIPNGSTEATISGLPVNKTILLSIEPSNLKAFTIGNRPDKLRLTDVVQWGIVAWNSLQAAYYGCGNLNITAMDIPNLNNVKDMSYIFYSCSILNGPANINEWNTTHVTNMTSAFDRASSFDKNIGDWNMVNVTDMSNMFFLASSFNQNLINWNTSNVRYMTGMFYMASSFNQSIGSWPLNANVNLNGMLNYAGLDCKNYSATLISWSSSNVIPSNRSIGAYGLVYGTSSVSARNILISKGWSISGDTAGNGTCSIAIAPDSNNVLYVNTYVTAGNSTGSSWNNAIKELSDALKWARSQNNFTIAKPLKIFVARGLYRPLYNASDGNFSINGIQDNAFVMVKNVQLYGGFDPANGISDLTKDRIFGDNGTVLSGDLGVKDDVTDNTYHVVISSGDIGNALLDGFVITKGNASSLVNVIVNNKSIRRNYGGGIHINNSNIQILNANISGNSATSANSSDFAYGGGIYSESSYSRLRNVNIYGNIATSRNYPASGGGIYNNSSYPVLTNVTIANNSVKGYSMFNSIGGGISNANNSRPIIYNSIIWGNTRFDNSTASDIENSGTTQIIIKNSITQAFTTSNPSDNNLVNKDPLFINPLAGDFKLQPNSPAIDRGDNYLYKTYGGNLINDKDLADNSRSLGCRIDMGAYEYQDSELFAKWEDLSWSNTTGPTQGLGACINDNYYINSSFTTKNLKVTSGTLSIKPNVSVIVYGNITQQADNKIILESDANLVQTDNTAVNSSHKITVKREVHMRQLDYTYWGSPVNGQKLLNDSALNDGFSIGTPNNRIYNYNEPNDYFVAATDQNFIPGKGYAIRGKGSFDVNNLTASTYQYNGTINNGVYSVNVQKSKKTKINGVEYEHGYNLIGNPYPSNIDFDKFFNLGTNKSKIFGKVWFWTNVAPRLNQSGSGYNGNNYATLTLTGGSPPTTTQPNTGLTPDQFIKVGQGFIVQVRDLSNLTSPTVTHQLDFDNSIRTDQGGIFFNAKISNTSKDRFWLQLISPQQFTNTILVGYVNGATNDYDGDYDAEMMSIGDDALYTLLGSKKNQIEGRQYPLSTDDVIQLGTKYSEDGIYQISIAGKEGIFGSGQPVYLRDKLLNKTLNLSESGHNFQAVKGNDVNRFEIVYKPQSYLDTQNTLVNHIEVYKDESDFVVKSIKDLKQVQVFDMSGKLINALSKASNTLRISHQNFPNGTFILKIYGGDNIITKKIIK